MTNEEKAREILKNNDLYGDSDNNSKTDECYITALEMATWKEEQMINRAVNILKEAEATGYGQCSCDFINTFICLMAQK